MAAQNRVGWTGIMTAFAAMMMMMMMMMMMTF